MASKGESTKSTDDNSDLIMSTSMSGNLSFDVVLSPPKKTPTSSSTTPRVLSKVVQSPPSGASSADSASISLEAITSKLKTAEENRGRRLDEKLEKIKEHEKHVSEVRKSREMQTFEGEESLRRLMMAEELRQQHLNDLVHKLKDHEKRIDQVHKRIAEHTRSTPTAAESETAELERQLGDASLHRDMVLQAIREKQQQESAGAASGGGQQRPKENVTP